MQKKIVYILAFLTISFSAYSQHATEHSKEQHELVQHEKKNLRERIKENIQHHLKDSHDFVFFSDTKKGKHYGFSLPIILWDDGLKIFSSSKFHHGETLAEVDGNHYKLYHGKIYKVDAQGTINYDEHHHPANVKPLDFSITKGVLSLIIMSALMLWLFISIARSYKKNNGVPKGIAGFLEPIILYIRDDIAIPNIGEKHYAKYMNYLLTVFFFVWFFNLIGLTPLGINVTGNIAITFALALITFLITQFTAKKTYWKHIFWMPGVPWLMKIILAPIELLGVFIKPFALMIRLYANISAGHIVLMSLIGLMFVFQNWIGSSLTFFLAFAISLIELLVALLQAYIFTMLSALYFGFAVEEHDDSH
jgi:F-type H+-transporting ATPase subunit a